MVKMGIKHLLSLALLLGMASPFVPLYFSAIPSYFGLVFPLIFIISIVVSIFSIGSLKSNKLFFITFFISIFFVPRFFNFSSPSQASDAIKVLSFNIRGGYSILTKDKEILKINTKNLNSFLSQPIDILLLQETNRRVAEWTNDYSSFDNKISSMRSGTLIATNNKILAEGEIDFGTKVNSCIWADVKTEQGMFRVYNVHFQSSKIYEDTEKAIKEGRQYDPNVFSSLNAVFSKYRKQGLKRIEQAKKVKAHMEQSPYPIVLGGDFNESPMSYTYQIMKHGLHDHFSEGSGYGATYPEYPSLVKIDYLMSSKNIECERFEILRNISLSDHLPILSFIKMNKTLPNE